MRPLVPLLMLAAACGGSTASTVGPRPVDLLDSTIVLDANGALIDRAQLLHHLAAPDFVLLGELHDNPIHHRIRGSLITALAARRPAVVFEQFADTNAPIPPPAAGQDRESWLDQHGFDRKGWGWPLHRPVIDAAVDHGRSLWGSGLSREALRTVVRGGESAAPAELRALLERAPLDSAARAAIDRELVDGHCGQLPPQMIPGMRAAQEARDAAMTRALLRAAADGPALLIAGNGHVRADIGVPRILHAVVSSRTVLAVGLLERDEDGALPAATDRKMYDLVIVTPRAAREDPCAGLTMKPAPR